MDLPEGFSVNVWVEVEVMDPEGNPMDNFIIPVKLLETSDYDEIERLYKVLHIIFPNAYILEDDAENIILGIEAAINQ
jgi:hypothetical protein